MRRSSLYSWTGINKPNANLQREGYDSQLESERQMLDALQFAWFQRENPLENSIVGSLPNLRDIWHFEKVRNPGAEQKHFYRER